MIKFINISKKQSPSRRQGTTANLVSGFTLVEFLIILGIMGVLSAILAVNISSFTSQQVLDKEAGIVVSILANTRSKALASEGSSAYGVNFDSSTVTIFKGTNYDPDDVDNVDIEVNRAVTVSVALTGGGSAVVFEKLKGTTAQDGTITLTLVASSTQKRTVTIHTTGLLE